MNRLKDFLDKLTKKIKDKYAGGDSTQLLLKFGLLLSFLLLVLTILSSLFLGGDWINPDLF